VNSTLLLCVCMLQESSLELLAVFIKIIDITAGRELCLAHDLTVL